MLALTSLKGEPNAILEQVRTVVGSRGEGQRGVDRLREILDGFAAATEAPARLQLDLSIARGLDYYTGVVLETFLEDLPDVGSVCSGGRYDDLASTFTKQKLPGIGASLGLDRLLAALEELGRLPSVRTAAPVLLLHLEADRLGDYLRIAAQLREAGLAVEFYPEAKKIKPQLKYADRRGFQIAVIIGSDEFAAGSCQVKDLQHAEQSEVALSADSAALIAAIRGKLG